MRFVALCWARIVQNRNNILEKTEAWNSIPVESKGDCTKGKTQIYNQGIFLCLLPFCKTTLTQGKNGTDIFVKYPLCGDYIHIIIQNDSVLTKRKMYDNEASD